jgi:hypothetical protein
MRVLAVLVLLAGVAHAATTDVADAAKRGDRDAVRAALARKADVNAAQIDPIHRESDYQELLQSILRVKHGRHFFNPAGAQLT